MRTKRVYTTVMAASIAIGSCKTTKGSKDVSTLKTDITAEDGYYRPLLSGFNTKTGKFTGNVCVAPESALEKVDGKVVGIKKPKIEFGEDGVLKGTNVRNVVPVYGQFVPDQRAEITFASNLSSEDLLQKMAGDLSVSYAQTGGLNASAGAKYAKSAGADDFSLSYSLIISLKASSVSLNNDISAGEILALTPIGETVSRIATDAINFEEGPIPEAARIAALERLRNLDFLQADDLKKVEQSTAKTAANNFVLSTCGDEIVDSIGFGAKYYATLKIVAANRTDRELIKGNLSVKSSGVSVEGSLELKDDKLKNNLFIEMSVLQVGGKPGMAPKAISTEVLACNKDNFASCINSFKQVVLYATAGGGTVTDTVQENGPTPGEVASTTKKVELDFGSSGFASQLNDETNVGYVVTGYKTRKYNSSLIEFMKVTNATTNREIARKMDNLNAEYKRHTSNNQRAKDLLNNFSLQEQVRISIEEVRNKTQTIQDRIGRVFIDCTDNYEKCLGYIRDWDTEKNGADYAYNAAALNLITGTLVDSCKRGLGISYQHPTDYEAVTKLNTTIEELYKFLESKDVPKIARPIAPWLKADSKTLTEAEQTQVIEACRQLELALGAHRTIELVGKKIENIEPLAFIANLQIINLSNNYITDISPLAKIPLRNIDVSKNPIKDLSVLSQSRFISTLNAGGTLVYDLSGLSGLNLATLSLASDGSSGTGAVDLSGYVNPRNLQRIDLTGIGNVDGLDTFLGYTAFDDTFSIDLTKAPPAARVKEITLSTQSGDNMVYFPGQITCGDLVSKMQAAYTEAGKTYGTNIICKR